MNSITYFEIQANNPQLAIDFYSKVFGWKFAKQDGLPVNYWRIETSGMHGGLMQRPAPAPSSGHGTNAFTCSMEVENFDVTAAKILRCGGTVAMEKFAVPGMAWQGYFLDTEGNTFGLFQRDERAA